MHTNNFVIENNVPVPRNEDKYPFRELEIGQSFAVPVSEKRGVQKVQQFASWCGRRDKKTFTTRYIKQEGIIRVWRTK